MGKRKPPIFQSGGGERIIAIVGEHLPAFWLTAHTQLSQSRPRCAAFSGRRPQTETPTAPLSPPPTVYNFIYFCQTKNGFKTNSKCRDR
ncbi:MAG: hypothetical protein A3D37_01450 [Candidatus Zambryskibacteria bacterium RIFCSPHIGHO2_02_FULL_38_22]|nr:MAG: hypothetical protein A3D37_01450 [Candidatus Zambryskibacteria bacterium RIFCSPHIGHO2_02_FULL_38_22]OHB09244.1 MAG: hypothetical protein A3I19_03005 [Candidatus Zambryskibacteria bacterium RIFCSPLOWO2_02_FULL_38_13]